MNLYVHRDLPKAFKSATTSLTQLLMAICPVLPPGGVRNQSRATSACLVADIIRLKDFFDSNEVNTY